MRAATRRPGPSPSPAALDLLAGGSDPAGDRDPERRPPESPTSSLNPGGISFGHTSSYSECSHPYSVGLSFVIACLRIYGITAVFEWVNRNSWWGGAAAGSERRRSTGCPVGRWSLASRSQGSYWPR